MTLRTTSTSVVFMLLMVGGGLLQAQSNYDAPMKTITIDGDLSDWNSPEHGVLSHSWTANTGGAPVNVDIKYAWDADNFYTLVQETTVDDDKVEGANAADWVSGPAPPDGDNVGPAAPWGTDSVGFYDGDRQLGEQMQWWIGLSSDDEQRHLRREAYEDDSTTLLIEDQSANNVTDGKRAVEFFMPWVDIRDDVSFPFHTPGHTLQDLAVGYSFRLDPLLVDGAGDGSMYNGQSFPGGGTGPLDVEVADQSIVVLAEAPMTATFLTGDINESGTVDSTDLGLLLNNFNKTGIDAAGGDLDADMTVDSTDLGLLLNNFNKSSASVVPEPASGILILIGLFGVVAGRRRRG